MNTVSIKHGSQAPTAEQLAPYELGYVSGGALYINNGGIIAQLTGPEVNDLVENGKITKSQFKTIEKADQKQEKILVADIDNNLLYRTPSEILEDINGYSKHGGDVSGNVNIRESLDVTGQSIFNGALMANGVIVLKEGITYGYVDPNEANIPGVKGQIYFLLPEE